MPIVLIRNIHVAAKAVMPGFEQEMLLHVVSLLLTLKPVLTIFIHSFQR